MVVGQGAVATALQREVSAAPFELLVASTTKYSNGTDASNVPLLATTRNHPNEVV